MNSLNIRVATGTGEGPTTVAAFHRALVKCRIGNQNLIALSSVIPPGSRVDRVDPSDIGCRWGDRLYCVLARSDAGEAGQSAVAGLGWVQDRDSGKGLFAEAAGDSMDLVTEILNTSLADMVDADDGEAVWLGPQLAIQNAVCIEQPICSIAIAAFTSEPWEPSTR